MKNMKRLFHLLSPFLSKKKLLFYVFLGLLSGLFSFLFINSITRVIGLITAGNFTIISKEYIIIFALIIILFIWVRRTLALAIVNLSQRLFWDLRKQILSLVLNANYQQLSGRKDKVVTAMLNDVHMLMDASLSVIQFSTSTILAISCLIYLATISLLLFCITLVIALVGVTVYHFSSSKNQRQFIRSRNLENKFQGELNSILDGFKEIFMEPKKGRFIYENNIRAIANESYINNKGAFTGFINNQITGQILFYVLISAILLYFSLVLKIKPADTVSFVFTLLYLLGSIESVMVLLPSIMRASVSSNHLMDLKKELEEANFSNPIPDKYISKDEFDNLTASNLEFYYGEDDKSFGIGPINFDVQKGETVFIYGGNGTGKTTFVFSLLGLCFPSAGEIRLNDVLVDDDRYPYYRTLFSVVFSDFYLFNEIFGIDHLDMDKWRFYLHLFELDDKVSIEGKSLSTTDLSTGQRKRLALIAALLEEKPVLVMDEWAADQDPHFRRKFYTEILPLLKKEGTTIIAITHDDKYYHCADKLYKMDYGKLILERVNVYEPVT